MTSYVICRKRLGIKKSDIVILQKSIEDRKLEYFKSEIIKILKKQVKKENTSVAKSIDFLTFLYVEKSAFGVGHVSVYKDGSMWKKIQNNPPKWKCIRQTGTFLTETSGAKQSITKLINKVRNCKNNDELIDIVLFNIGRFRDEEGQILPIVEKLKEEVDIKKVTMTGDKKAAFENLTDFVNDKNFKENIKLSRDEIFSKYDNKPLKIAKLPPLLQKFFGTGNGFINCGKAYMIDHMTHNHPTTPLPLYRRIQYILDSAKDFYFDTKTGAFAIVEEYGNKKGKPCKNILLFKKDEDDNLVLHKTFYDTTKNIPSKFKKYALADIQQGLTSERVEHTLIGRSEETSAPASGSISGRSDSSDITQNYSGVNRKPATSSEVKDNSNHVTLTRDKPTTQQRMEEYHARQKYAKSQFEIGENVTDKELKKLLSKVKHSQSREDYINDYYLSKLDMYEEKELTDTNGYKGKVTVSRDRKENQDETNAALFFQKKGCNVVMLSETQRKIKEKHPDLLVNGVLVEIKTCKDSNSNGIASEIKNAINKRNTEISTIFLFDKSAKEDYRDIVDKLNKKKSYLVADVNAIMLIKDEVITLIDKKNTVGFSKEAPSANSSITQNYSGVNQK